MLSLKLGQIFILDRTMENMKQLRGHLQYLKLNTYPPSSLEKYLVGYLRLLTDGIDVDISSVCLVYVVPLLD